MNDKWKMADYLAFSIMLLVSLAVAVLFFTYSAKAEKPERATADKPGIQVDVGEDRITILCRCEQVKR